MNGPGYRFLCDRLKEGVAFYVIAEPKTNLPYYFLDSKHIFFRIYSNIEGASTKCDELALNKRYVIPTLLNAIGWTDILWKRYWDLGASHILLDYSVWVNISDLTAASTYEGILSPDTPLRNPTLNAVMYCYRQDVIADFCTDAMTALFWETFKKSKFYAPLKPIRTLRSGEALNSSNPSIHYIKLRNGSNAFLLFTDNEFKSIYAGNMNLKCEDHKVVSLFDYADIYELISRKSGLYAIINAYGGGLTIISKLIEHFDSISLNQSALIRRSSPCSRVFPMLDFFQNIVCNFFSLILANTV